MKRLAEGARAGTLKPEELRGSTFTVTSAGKLAGLFQTPIVNHPEVAILSVGRIAERPVVRDGEVTTAPVGYVSVTFDHRVVDGARAAGFGLAVIRRLEQIDLERLTFEAPSGSLSLIWPRISPPGQRVVWMFAYALPARIALRISANEPGSMPCAVRSDHVGRADVALDRALRRSGTESASCFRRRGRTRRRPRRSAVRSARARRASYRPRARVRERRSASLSGATSFARKSPTPVDETAGVSW